MIFQTIASILIAVPFVAEIDRRRRLMLRQTQHAPFGTVLGYITANKTKIPVYSCDYISLHIPRLLFLFLFKKMASNYEKGVYTGVQYQCVELARRHLWCTRGYVFKSVGMAYELFQHSTVHNPHDETRIARLKKNVNGQSTLPPGVGTYPIWQAGGFFEGTGHVAVVVGVNVAEGWVDIAEQNVEDRVWPAGIHASRRLKLVKEEDANGKLGWRMCPTFEGAEILGWLEVEEKEEVESKLVTE